MGGVAGGQMHSRVEVDEWVACHDCDLLHRRRTLKGGEVATCRRCFAVLYERKRNPIDRTLAWCVTALILFVLANIYPFMTFRLEGREQTGTILSGVVALLEQGMWPLAGLVFFMIVLAPLAILIGLLYLLAPLRLGRRAFGAARVFRIIEQLRPWGMLEVYMLGVLVAIVKLSQMASIDLGLAFWSFSALLVATIGALVSLDEEVIWSRVEVRR